VRLAHELWELEVKVAQRASRLQFALDVALVRVVGAAEDDVGLSRVLTRAQSILDRC
jgi:hypothetical protein